MPGVTTSAASMRPSTYSMRNQIGYKVRNFAHYGQPTIEITLTKGQGVHSNYATSYSTMDTIEGTVAITAPHDTRFEDIEIAFLGTSNVFVDKLTTTPSVTGRTEATHRFLALKQPISESDLPCPRKLIAGKTYVFPFTFTVPLHLLPRACTHKVGSDHIHDMHMLLPPSLGDPELAGFGGTLLDDLAPEMSKIVYAIKARIRQYREADGSISVLAEKQRKVRVKPAYEEQPPMNLNPSDSEYRVRIEKSIRKGLFKGKLGTLVAQGPQPKALVIPGARTKDNGLITTKAKIFLRFDPADDSATPPPLGSLATKLRVATYYSSAPRHGLPSRSALGFDVTQGLYQETLSLSSMCIASAQWTKQTADANPTSEDTIRRDSAFSDCSTSGVEDSNISGIPLASKNYRGANFYTATILVPVTLPKNRSFVPTFHSCLISRVYTLSLTLSVHAPGVTDPSLHLKIPIQIAADGSTAGNENARARRQESLVASEADAMFTPRSVAPPPNFDGGPGVPAASVEHSDLPPEYEVSAPRLERHGHVHTSFSVAV
ncbi:hypothetical protein P154DRAFT_523933 [Amniculicola lignicola CBS 123094]|uniref:Arrestin-like N-terminal domain-containing protein n=1 Tax=Amniculicola lignicola CBS 123094 TaxID=1392246 RepID=A0A6A5W9R6_9PLEO|nr:hypothetical protein P154DRAFT_523933 [Amniculicola lignicola CBS 123094]